MKYHYILLLLCHFSFTWNRQIVNRYDKMFVVCSGYSTLLTRNWLQLLIFNVYCWHSSIGQWFVRIFRTYFIIAAFTFSLLFDTKQEDDSLSLNKCKVGMCCIYVGILKINYCHKVLAYSIFHIINPHISLNMYMHPLYSRNYGEH